MKAIDEKIEENAVNIAREAIDEVRLEKERKINNFHHRLHRFTQIINHGC